MHGAPTFLVLAAALGDHEARRRPGGPLRRGRRPGQTQAVAPPDQGRADLSLLTLGTVDVDPEVLTGAGGSLREAIGERPIDDRTGNLAPRLPKTGWRLIHRSPAQPGWGGNESCAAPCGDTADSGWAVVNVSSPAGGGDWILSADPGPVHVFPGRAARRAGLSLSWPDDLTATAGSTPALSIRLRNATNQVWRNEKGDTAHVRGWLLGADGTSPTATAGHYDTCSTCPPRPP